MKFIKTGVSKLYILVLMLILCCTGIGTAAFIHSTIGDIGSSGTAGSPSLVDVARVARKNANGKIEWTTKQTVEEALSFANQSGDVVTIIPGSFASIHGNCEIKNGVTLAIPIKDQIIDATSENGNNDTAYHVDSDEKHTVSLTYTVVNTLTLKENATLTLNGTAKLVVYGQLSGGNGGGDYCGQPFGNISELKMEAGSSIVCNGYSSITAYGIITDARTDKSTQTQGKITMNSGTDIKTPYIIRDFKGGTVSAAIYKETKGFYFPFLIDYKPDMPIYQAPFYQFQVLNIEPVLEVLYGGTLTGVVNINAGEQMNMKTMKVFGTDSSSFLEFTDEEHSKIVADYNEKTEVCDITIYGGAKMNGMSISIKIPIVGEMSFNTADYVYPLTWRHRITLCKDDSQTEANFIVPQDFKCLPGSYFEVGPGCKIDFQCMLTVLNYGAAGTANCFNDINYLGELYKYCKSSTYSQSVVNPTFINKGHVSMGTGGGLIQAGAAGATLIATGSNSAVSYEATTYSGSSFYCVVDSYETKTNVLRGKVEGVSGETTLEVGQEYISNSDKEWSFNEKLILSSTNISFNTTETAELTLTVYGLEGYSPTIDTGNNNLSYTLSEPIEDTTLRIRTYTITLSATSDLNTTLSITVGEKTAYCSVSASATTVSVTGVTLNITSHTLTITDDNSNPTLQLIATVLPIDATNQTVTWSSNKPEIATVDKNTGLVTAQRGGTATITVTTEDGEFTAQSVITVEVPAQSVDILNKNGDVVNDTTLHLEMTDDYEHPTLELKAVVNPTTTTDTISWSSSKKSVATVEDGTVTAQGGGTATITVTCGSATAKCTISVTDNTSCLVEGTLITMADGTKVPVENVKAGDELLVFNHETGKYDVAPVLFNDSEPLANYNVVYLEFDDGNKVGVVYEHGFFDKTTMQYEYITEDNYEQFIGHEFVNVGDGNNFSTTKLINAYVVTENVRVYSPVTKYHLNYFTEDMLSMPGGIKGLFNIFEMDEDLSYNEEAKARDIETYGLFTYEDFKDYVSYEIYESFPAAYFKVSLGKGLMTWEDLLYYIERYTPLM